MIAIAVLWVTIFMALPLDAKIVVGYWTSWVIMGSSPATSPLAWWLLFW